MPTIRAFSFGWELDHPTVSPLAWDDAAAWRSAQVLLFSPLAVEQLWQHAVGSRSRLFRSARRERDCWDRLLQLIHRLQAHLERGGHLITRLDLPTSRCQVRLRPSQAHFPPGSELNAYEALATVDAGFMLLAQRCGRLPVVDCVPRPLGHPLDEYLSATAPHARPVVGLPETPANGETLATTSAGHAVAWIHGHAVWLPPLAAPATAAATSRLLDAVQLMLGHEPALTMLAAGSSPCARRGSDESSLARRQRLLEARIAKLSALRDELAQQRAARDWLVERLDRSASVNLVEFVAQTAAALNSATEGAIPRWHAAQQDRGAPPRLICNGELGKPAAELEIADRPCAATPAKGPATTAWGRFDDPVPRVPLVELREALAVAFSMGNEREPLARLGDSLRRHTTGLWQFHPRELALDTAEWQGLGVTEVLGRGNSHPVTGG